MDGIEGIPHFYMITKSKLGIANLATGLAGPDLQPIFSFAIFWAICDIF